MQKLCSSCFSLFLTSLPFSLFSLSLIFGYSLKCVYQLANCTLHLYRGKREKEREREKEGSLFMLILPHYKQTPNSSKTFPSFQSSTTTTATITKTRNKAKPQHRATKRGQERQRGLSGVAFTCVK